MLLLLLVATAILGGGESAERSFVVEPASRADLIVIITATGSVQPTNQVDVSSELSGTIRHVFVDFNSPVKIGQVLAELDTHICVDSRRHDVRSRICAAYRNRSVRIEAPDSSHACNCQLLRSVCFRLVRIGTTVGASG